MRKHLIRLSLILLLFISFFTLTGCERDFDNYDVLVIKEFINKDDIKAIEFNSVNAYHKNKKFYYDVEYTKSDKHYNVLFVCSGDEINTLINISNIDQVGDNNKDIVNDYLKAKEKGEYHYLDNDKIKTIIKENNK